MVGIGLIALSVGITLMGYFMGKGLQNLGHPEIDKKYNYFITKEDLEIHLNLSENEIEELLSKYPNAPKIELRGTTYYPCRKFMEWLSTNRIYNQ